MNTQIQDDFRQFMNDVELFNCTVILYNTESANVFSGKAIYDRKPDLVENESGLVAYSGHKSVLTLSMVDLTFMDKYFSLQGYTVEITDNTGTRTMKIADSSYNSNVNTVFCYLKE